MMRIESSAPSRLRPPPNHSNINEIIEIAPAIVAAIELVKVSLFFTWPISWPITAFSSFSLSRRRIPVVTATTPFSGLRPVAKAFGVAVSITKSFGIGI